MKKEYQFILNDKKEITALCVFKKKKKERCYIAPIWYYPDGQMISIKAKSLEKALKKLIKATLN